MLLHIHTSKSQQQVKALSKVPRNLWKNTVQSQHQRSLYGHCSVFIVEFEQVFSNRERSS